MPTESRTLPIRFRRLAIVSALYATRDRAKPFVHVNRSLRQRTLPVSFFSELFIHPRALKSVLALVGHLVNQDARPAMETVDRIWQNRSHGSF